METVSTQAASTASVAQLLPGSQFTLNTLRRAIRRARGSRMHVVTARSVR